MDKKKTSIWEAHAGYIVVIWLIVGNSMSVFSESWTVFILNILLAAISIFICYYFHEKNISLKERNNRSSHVFFTLTGIYFIEPLIYSMEGTLGTVLILFFSLIIWIVTYIFRTIPFTVLTTPKRSKWSFVIAFLLIALFIAFTGTDRRNSEGWAGAFLTEAGEFIYVYAIFYTIGLLSFFLANGLLGGLSSKEE